MRPTPGAPSALPARSRGHSFSDNDATPMPTQYLSQGGGMTYFLADEKTLESSSSNIQTNHPRPRYGVKPGMYGVESIESTISSLGSSRQPPSPRIPANKKSHPKPQSRKSEEDFHKTDWTPASVSGEHSRDVSPYDRLPRRPSQTISQPLTPLFSPSPAPESTTSSAHSRRGSDLDSLSSETISQVISSSDEETELQPEVTDSGSAPQLVMPSIKMPSRRPFTDKGRNMGRLKIMVAGDSGIGKTSLIKAIVQACEDIVHVDPLSTTPLSVSDATLKKSKSKSRAASIEQNTTQQLTEVYASTRAYPSWWSDFDEGRVLRKRRSVGDTVLERNLCFVDSPGYGDGNSCMETITPVINYIEEQMGRTASTAGMSDADLISMLSGNGGSQVDVVFYVISRSLKPVDLEYLRRLSPLTNIIPVLAQADRFNDEQISFQKRQVLSELHMSDIKPFLFGMTFEDALNASSPCAPWAISSIATSDSENMDASILMSPDYIQPLLSTDLQELVSLVFERDSISWLRHSAAKKIMTWRKNSPSPSPLYTPAMPFGTASLSSSASSVLPPIGLSNSYALARVADHTQREERYAQVRLAKWASELQRSIENERARYEALCRGERAIWLTERLGECVQDGSLVPISHARSQPQSNWSPEPKQNNHRALVKKGIYSPSMVGVATFDPRDPLGLLSFDKEIRRKGLVALQVLGGAGVVGGVIVWLARTWNGEGWSWGVEWNRLGMDW